MIGVGSNLVKWILIHLITHYQITASTSTRNKCCMYPSCSAYARRAIENHGPRKGLLMAIRRLYRCEPTQNGFDPVR
ncbi:membrane protein insertion efficiency factor YidD [Litoricolaceae bacterium]|nr:membrane protein insertion efficiency factor YidD [Litorivicinaceae bacterium]